MKNLLQRLLRWIRAHSRPDKVMYIGGSDVLPAPLRPEDERRAIEALAAGDETARQTLIEHNLRLVAHIVKKMCSKMQISLSKK